jgi:tetratricopeptide (TPR) repeat protein
MENSSSSSEKLQLTANIFEKAEDLKEKSFYPQALKLFKQTLNAYRKADDPNGIFLSLIALGDTYRMTGRFDLAASHYAEAIEIAGKLKSPVLVADAKVGLGLSLRAQGQWSNALKLIRQSRAFYQRKNDKEGIAFTLWAAAGALRIKGDISETLKTYKESLSVFRSLKDSHGEGYCLCGLGGASRIAGLPKSSLKYYLAANRLFAGLKDKFGTAYSYCGIGNAYRMLGDYRIAFDYFRKASRLYEKIGDIVSYSYTLWGIGTAYKMLGEYGKASDYFKKAMANFKKTRDPRGAIYCMLGQGEIALMTGRKTSAEKYLVSALKESVTHRFAVEKCYADTLKSFVLRGKTDNACYDRLGLKLRFHELPLNIP